jgi:hypothetical protein
MSFEFDPLENIDRSEDDNNPQDIESLGGAGGLCPGRLLGHRGAWLEERFPNMNEGNEITIKWI